ncbi:transient receptor potential cation channel protein painless-like [Aethina tumida]|uniref:transient receptor potential cation channel protein painless-like n=1 Tax=Aethina tumida TaxID=116153 RepID=UPI0021477672|nr:transient receptor potential cation channel protein painless-like [Aethina tumida]
MTEKEYLDYLDDTITYDENGGTVVINTKDLKFKQAYEKILNLSKNLATKRVMNHPVITVLLIWNWHRECWRLYLSYLLIYLTYFILIVSFIFQNHEISTNLLVYFIITLTILFMSIELLQMWCYKWSYLVEIENYLQILLLIYTVLTIWKKKFTDCNCDIYVDAFPFGYNLAFLFIVLFFILGELPAFAVSVNLYKTVLWNFIKHMSIYSLLLLSFASAFFTQNLRGSISDYNPRNISSSVFTTYIMFFGEFNSDDIDFENLPYHYMVVFLLFLLCVPLVLSNLLIGLAISDMEKLKMDAQYFENVERVKAIKIVRLLDNKQFVIKVIVKFLKLIKIYIPRKELPENIKIKATFQHPKYIYTIEHKITYIDYTIWKMLIKRSRITRDKQIKTRIA